MNPQFYKETDIQPMTKKTAKEIWARDAKKLNEARLAGFEIFIIWNNDWRKNKKEVIENITRWYNE
jgi:very-short-patch-repair endonuclease